MKKSLCEVVVIGEIQGIRQEEAPPRWLEVAKR